MKRFSSARIAFALLIISGIGCMPFMSAGPVHAAETVQSMQYGVSLSPKSFSAEDLADFYNKAGQAGSVLSWAGDWIETETPGGSPDYVMTQAAAHGLTPVILLQFFNQSTGQLLRPLDTATQNRYKADAVAFATKWHPPYLGLGVEVNVLAEKNPFSFITYALFFDKLVPAIKAVSPNTKVFTTFELERMKGLKGGLFGGVNDPTKNNWGLLGWFPKTDLVAFSTYPSLVYHDPSEISATYYSDITKYTRKPIAFTEAGWHSEASPAGWEGSEAKQLAFVNKLKQALAPLNPGFVIWSFLYDQNVVEPFRSMGFFSREGVQKTAWPAWISH